METSRTPELDPEAQQVLRRLAPRLAKRAEQIMEAATNAEEVLADASEDRLRKQIGFNFATYYEECKVIGILLDFAHDERRSLLTIDGGLTGDDADHAMEAVNRVASSRRLRRALCTAAPKWFRPRASMIVVGSTADASSYRPMLRLVENGAISEVYSSFFYPPHPAFIEAADVTVLLLSPRFLREEATVIYIHDLLRHNRNGDVLVIPVIVRPLDGELDQRLQALNPLPADLAAVALRADLEDAWLEVLAAIGERIRDWIVPGWRERGSLSRSGESTVAAPGTGAAEILASRKALFITFDSAVYDALRFHLERVKEESLPNGTILERGSFLHGKWSVALVDGETRIEHSVASLDAAIEFFTPEIIAVVSLGIGVRRVTPGDVVMASDVDGFATLPASNQERGRKAWQLSFPLDQRARMEARKREWIRRLPSQELEREPHIIIGPVGLIDPDPVAMAPFVPRDGGGSNFGSVVAFNSAAHHSLFVVLGTKAAEKSVEMAVIFGITGGADDPNSQGPAARNASAFAMELLAKL